MIDLNITWFDKTLPIMYLLCQMHNTPIGARLMAASKNCSTKPLSQIQNFQNEF